MVLAKNIEVLFPAAHGRPTYRLRRVISCTVESGWEKLTDTCELVISRNIKGMKLDEVRDAFRRGDGIEISFGYNGELRREFTGYIIDVDDDKHLTFKCQDEMYKLKTGTINFNKKRCKLKDVLDAINAAVVKAGGIAYELDVPDAELGNVRIKGISAAEALLRIKDGYGIYSYFRDGKLVSGKINQGSNVRYRLNYDTERNIKSHSLTYKRAEDVRVQVKVSSVLSSGRKIEVTVGDEDGTQSDIQLIGITNTADLKKKAEHKLALMKQDGFEGDVSLFGIPFVRFGDEVELYSAKHPERTGAYYIDSTSVKYVTAGGIERVIKLGSKAA